MAATNDKRGEYWKLFREGSSKGCDVLGMLDVLNVLAGKNDIILTRRGILRVRMRSFFPAEGNKKGTFPQCILLQSVD